MLTTRSGRRPSQREDELRPFIALLKERGVRSYLEIGARHGDTFYEVMTSLPVGSRGVAVDMPNGPWGTASSQNALRDAVDDLRAAGYDAKYMLGNSQSWSVVSDLHRGPRFDAILIDGDHRLAGVTADWENYRDLAPIVAFHDIAGEGIVQASTKDPVEVPILWQKIKAQHETIEFVGAARGMGIGVVLL